MSDHIRTLEIFDRQPDSDRQIKEGGWQKPVAPPGATSRPSGLPPVIPPTPSSSADNKERSDAG